MGRLPRSRRQSTPRRDSRAGRSPRHAQEGGALLCRGFGARPHADPQARPAEAKIITAIAIHGGAGAMPRRKMAPAASARYKAGLTRALEAGFAVLAKHGSAMDAVCAAVVELEDSPLFNAGRGACFNTDEKHELDASVMDGATLAA